MRSGARLTELLPSLDPWRRPGEVVYVALPLPDHVASALRFLASVDEPEGRCAVVPREGADARGLAYDFVATWITLRMHSSLADVGLTAAVSSALAAAGISCNVISGLHHDHLLVPTTDTDRAVAILEELSARPGSHAAASAAGTLGRCWGNGRPRVWPMLGGSGRQ